MTTEILEVNNEKETSRAIRDTKKRTPEQRVVKNSFWLIAQPLILNFISIFVVGYIARTLGQADYGKFVFAFAFVSLFNPLANFGLRAITVREIAEEKNAAGTFAGKMAVFRFFLALLAISAVFISINLMGYPQMTKTVVYIASLTILFRTTSTTFQDVFQAHEKMQYVAYTRIISGLTLTALSVIVLYIGFGLIELTMVYVFGSLLALILATLFLLKRFTIPKLRIDLSFFKQNLYKGLPFFSPSLVTLIGTKIGIIFLSKMTGDASVGVYGAANNLVEKLVIVPDGICTAAFPTIAALYKNSRDAAASLFHRAFLSLFLLGLPIAIGTSILARRIVTLIYGDTYTASIFVLQILVWWLFFRFLTSIQGVTLGAIHKEKKNAKIRIITASCGVVLSLLLIPRLKELGLAISMLLMTISYFFLLFVYIKRYLVTSLIKKDVFFKAVAINGIMGVLVFLLKDHNLFLVIPGAALFYLSVLLKLKIVKKSDLLNIKAALMRGK